MGTEILICERLSKSFGKANAVSDVNLTIEKGEVYGLVGQNGAGKTTLMRLICGLMKPTQGKVLLRTEKPLIGYMPQSCRFDEQATVMDTVRFYAKLRDVDVKKA